MRRDRAGSSLVELMLALGGAVFLGACIAGLLAWNARLAQHAVTRSDALDAMHAAALLLSREIRALDATDLVAVSSDSVALRVFRGAGRVCAEASGDAMLLWSGARDPDPAKDSLLVLEAFDERVVAFTSVTVAPAGTCGATSRVMRLTPDTTLPLHSAVLAFERGSYHLYDPALRYRPAGSGRQPLTASVFDASKSGFVRSGSEVRVDLVPGRAREIPGSPLRAAPARRRITMLNRRRRRAG